MIPEGAPAPVRLLVCVGPRCDAEGRGRALLAAIEEALAAAMANEIAAGRLAVETRDCLRLCTRDPVVRIEPSGDAFANPDVAELTRAAAEALSPRAAVDSTPNSAAPSYCG
jgi:NADH:ubiquinone oxidoreductase subunit E